MGNHRDKGFALWIAVGDREGKENVFGESPIAAGKGQYDMPPIAPRGRVGAKAQHPMIVAGSNELLVQFSVFGPSVARSRSGGS